MILGVPTLTRYDLLDELIRSAEAGDVRPSRYVIVDNGVAGYGEARARDVAREVSGRTIDVELIREGRNIGVAPSWNRILEASLPEPVFISGDDAVLAPRNVADAEIAAASSIFVTHERLASFVVTRECVERIGWFDEHFFPLWYEDVDYYRRLGIAQVKIAEIPGPALHRASSTSGRMTSFLPSSRRRYVAKWGGDVHSERWSSPFDGKPPSGWNERLHLEPLKDEGSPPSPDMDLARAIERRHARLDELWREDFDR